MVLAKVIGIVGMISFGIFFGYAALFSNPRIRIGYIKLRRVFDVVFAVFFGIAGFNIFVSSSSS